MAPVQEKIKVRGLAVIAASLLGFWGVVVACKGVYDLFVGEPDANLYSSYKWQFVTQEQWLRYGGFELAYGLACAGLAYYVWRYGKFLPATLTREKPEPPFQLFG